VSRTPATIHVAYSASTKHGSTSYWAKAVVTDDGFKGYNTVRTGLGDSAVEAVDEAIGYVIESYRRDCIDPPETTILYGRVPRSDIVNVSFLGVKH